MKKKKRKKSSEKPLYFTRSYRRVLAAEDIPRGHMVTLYGEHNVKENKDYFYINKVLLCSEKSLPIGVAYENIKKDHWGIIHLTPSNLFTKIAANTPLLKWEDLPWCAKLQIKEDIASHPCFQTGDYSEAKALACLERDLRKKGFTTAMIEETWHVQARLAKAREEKDQKFIDDFNSINFNQNEAYGQKTSLTLKVLGKFSKEAEKKKSLIDLHEWVSKIIFCFRVLKKFPAKIDDESLCSLYDDLQKNDNLPDTFSEEMEYSNFAHLCNEIGLSKIIKANKINKNW